MDQITPTEAYRKVKADSEDTFIIDVRSQAEYELIGHPPMAYNIPYKFWTSGDEKRNARFVKEVLGDFSRSDTLLLICRSGNRSASACEELIEDGFENIMNIEGGFEGPKVENKESIYHGYRRRVSGWQHAGLPYTYEIDPNLSYKS